MDLLNKTISLPFVTGDLVLIKKNPSSDDKAPNYYLGKVKSIMLEATGRMFDPGEYEFRPSVIVIAKHLKGKNDEYAAYPVHSWYILGPLDSKTDIVSEVDELLSLPDKY